ncbi:MAG: extracellular solute-binding protein [Spirochaetaceae bacterium]|jgi:putative aldouronate transport system substrate-binding protein|nr:extracellular solute-binding protein [Spirochaetaceae bacterium]
MKTRKIMALLALGAAVFVLGGCAKKGGGAGGPQKVVVEVFDRGTDGGKTSPTDNQWTKWIKEKALKDENLVVEFVAVNRWDEATALTNLMAAGTPPDVCITYNNGNITSWAEQGGLFNVAPYLDSTLKDLNDFLGEDKALPGRRMIERQRDEKTGEIYSMPARRMNVARLNTFIRKDWLDKLGLPLPRTTQEYYDALAAFKEKDPGGVGKEKVIPFSTAGLRIDWGAGTMLDSFLDPEISVKELWINSVVERFFLVRNYKEGLRFLNKMYNAGLVDRDFPLYKDDNTLYNLLKSGVVGSFIHNWDQIYRDGDAILKDLQKNIPTAELVPVDCFTSSDGVTHKTIYDAAGAFYFIPAGAKNPDAAMRYLNWLSRYENYHFIQVGPEGVVHTMVDGVPKINPTAGDGWMQNSSQNIDYTLMMNGLFLGNDDENIKALAAGYSWPAEKIVGAYEMSLTNGRPAIIVTTTGPLTVAGPLTQTLTDKGVVIFTKSIQAKPSDFDATYDALIKDWLDSGAQKVVDERREKFIDPFNR